MAASNHTHRLAATPATVHWGFLDAALGCVLEIESGDRLCIETVSGGKARLPADRERFGVLPDHLAILEACSPDLGPHILTGPVHIRGAEPGNVLRVFIETIKLRQNWGWNEIATGCGLLPEHEALAETLTIPIDLQAGVVHLPWGGSVNAQPFFGVLAVKPDTPTGRVSSLIPGPFGGNLDVRHLGPGTEIYFPIFAAGAGFSAGDGHAIQGDGEINGSAVETSLAGTFVLTVDRQIEPPPFPYALTNSHLLTLAVDIDLDQALEWAVRSAVNVLSSRFAMSARDAYRHCSVVGHAAVSQCVNVRKGIHFRVPLPH